jgi:hypothetical protein
MIQCVLHAYHCALLDWEQPRDLVEAEEDLRDAVVEETCLLKFDDCPIEEVEEMAMWCIEQEEAADAAGVEWQPDGLGELEQALLRRMFDHENDLREPAAAE